MWWCEQVVLVSCLSLCLTCLKRLASMLVLGRKAMWKWPWQGMPKSDLGISSRRLCLSSDSVKVQLLKLGTWLVLMLGKVQSVFLECGVLRNLSPVIVVLIVLCEVRNCLLGCISVLTALGFLSVGMTVYRVGMPSYRCSVVSSMRLRRQLLVCVMVFDRDS